MTRDEYAAQAMMTAKQVGLPPLLVLAIIEQESDWDTHAVRYEPHFKHLSGENLSPTEETMQKSSWGLMQVMGGTARWLGLRSRYIPELTRPRLGLLYGCKYLKYQMNRYGGDIEKSVAAYNAGSARETKNGVGETVFVNQDYVDSVMAKNDDLMRGGDFNG